MKLLIVEDNPELLDNMLSYLSREQYTCETATDYDQAFHKIMSYSYDVVLIDIMIPKGDGLQLLFGTHPLIPDRFVPKNFYLTARSCYTHSV